MFPGLSPIYINPLGIQTNRPPLSNVSGWSLAQSPNVTIPNIPPHIFDQPITVNKVPAFMETSASTPPPMPIAGDKDVSVESGKEKKEETKEHHLFGKKENEKNKK